MSRRVIDLALAGLWLLILIAGAGVCAWLYRRGLPRTYVRDLLHVGAGCWVFGWPGWEGWAVPTLIPALAVGGLLLLSGNKGGGRLAGFRQAVSDADERWSGLVLYALAVAILTPVGILWAPFPAAAALLALALGDGLGGLVGRNFGRRRFQLPGGKPKSLEGAAVVALASGVGIWVAAGYFQSPVSLPTVWWAAAVACLAEAVAPRATDNLLVPAAVFAVLIVLG